MDKDADRVRALAAKRDADPGAIPSRREDPADEAMRLIVSTEATPIPAPPARLSESDLDKILGTDSVQDTIREEQPQSGVVDMDLLMSLSRQRADGGGTRHDVGKNRLDLLPPEWLWALADVTTQGSKKYAERNWERGMAWSKMVGCAMRHVVKFLVGERYDPDTGCHHLAMAAWNCLALMSYDLRGVGTDDLPESSVAILAAVNPSSANNPVDKPAG